MRHILFFGNSLTAGYGLSNASRESFPALIQQKIRDEVLPFEVINGGVSGDTTAGGLNRLGYWISRPIDTFVLELGINDIMRGIPPAVIYKNLQTIIDRVKLRYPTVNLALMGMHLPAFVPVGMMAEFQSVFSKLAATYKMAFVPFFLEGVMGIRDLNLDDGLHPSAKGYQIIAEKVWPVLRPLLIAGE